MPNPFVLIVKSLYDLSQHNVLKRYEISMSTSGEAHLHRSKARKQKQMSITQVIRHKKEFKVESTHVIYHNHVDITIT